MPRHDCDFTPDYVESYQKGEQDCIDGKPKRSNPFEYSGSEEKRQGWIDGWNAAAQGR